MMPKKNPMQREVQVPMRHAAECSLRMLNDIISQECLITLFQPICSIPGRCVVGLEALSRGLDPQTGMEVSPDLLFAAAKTHGLTVILDRLCRKKALQEFVPLHRERPDCALFLNFEAGMLDKEMVGSGILRNRVEELELNPANIVIEVIESLVYDVAALEEFAQTHKDAGFLLALDDLGAGHSNLERISRLKPDILKVDRSIAQGIELEYYKQEIFRSLVNLGHKLGALVVAEGIETHRQSLEVMELGADLIQGYHLHRPARKDALQLDELGGRINELGAALKAAKRERAARAQRQEELLAQVPGVLAGRLGGVARTAFDEVLAEAISGYDFAECMYILDAEGIQISETALSIRAAAKPERFLFHPASSGVDHSLKSYYLELQEGAARFLTAPYISMATGRLCRTLSLRFSHPEGAHILCVDLAHQS